MNLEVGIKGGRRNVCALLLLPENSTRDHELSLVLGSEVVFSWLCNTPGHWQGSCFWLHGLSGWLHPKC